MHNEVFDIKDSGSRTTFVTGMQRDNGEKTLRPDLIWMPGIIRLANHYGKGAIKYAPRNWEKAETQEELDRFLESAYRHFIQFMNNERDEDHMAAVIFNLFGAEMVRQKLNVKSSAI
jgi:hypothetical protein